MSRQRVANEATIVRVFPLKLSILIPDVPLNLRIQQQ